MDEHTLSLPAGAHVLAILVHHVGEVNATMMKGRPGLLVELSLATDDAGAVICSDASWRCLPAPSEPAYFLPPVGCASVQPPAPTPQA